MNIHPKTSGAAVGGAFGVLISSILSSIHGVHLDPSVYGSITTFLSVLGAWLVPSPVTPVTCNQQPPPPPPPPAA